jgi:7-carboxy-7-deazaguanine synthase
MGCMQGFLHCQIIHRTIQGEGKFAGEPSMFIRTAVCNLSCSWCDTKYSWEQKYKDTWKEVTAGELEEQFPKHAPRMGLVITGGEPMLWEKNQEFRKLMIAAWGAFHRVTIETNGTILPQWLLRYDLQALHKSWGVPIDSKLWFSVSPKLANGGDERFKRFKLDTLRKFAKTDNVYFKFVIGNVRDLQEMQYDFGFISPERIWLMPLGATTEELRKTTPEVIRACIEHGYRYSPRLHIGAGIE